jgi:hypothetical protein
MEGMRSLGMVGTILQHLSAEHNTAVRTSVLGKQNLPHKSKKEFEMLIFVIINLSGYCFK